MGRQGKWLHLENGEIKNKENYQLKKNDKNYRLEKEKEVKKWKKVSTIETEQRRKKTREKTREEREK